MPIYEYCCEDCEHEFEKIVKMSQADLEQVCPECGAAHSRRKLSRFAVGRGGGSGASAPASAAPRPRFS